MIRVEFVTDTAAFHPEAHLEAARILRHIAARFEERSVAWDGTRNAVLDAKATRVGTFTATGPS